MADVLGYQASHSAVYFTSPRKFEPTALVIALLGGSITAVLGSFAYVMVFPRLKDPFVCAGAVVAAAIATGIIAFVVTRHGKVSSLLLGVSIGTALGLLTLYSMWLIWLHDRMNHGALQATWGVLIVHPLVCLRLVRIFNGAGTWILMGQPLRGISLFICWLLESGAVLGASVFMSMKAVTSPDPVCSKCKVACKRASNLRRFSVDEQSRIISAVEGRAFSSLASHAPLADPNDPEIKLSLLTCPKCGEMNVLFVGRLEWTFKNHVRVLKSTKLIDGLLITRAEAQELDPLKVVEAPDPEIASAAETSSPESA